MRLLETVREKQKGRQRTAPKIEINCEFALPGVSRTHLFHIPPFVCLISFCFIFSPCDTFLVLRYFLRLPLPPNSGSTFPSWVSFTLQSKVFPALDLHPRSTTGFPTSRFSACFTVNFLLQNPNSLNPQPSTCFQLPSFCFSFLLEEQV